jgi:hypothetical protein
VWWIWTVSLNAMLALGGFWVAQFGLRQPAGFPRILAAATLAWAWISLGLELTGSFGWLWLGPLAIWTSLGLLIGLCLRWRASRSSTQPPLRDPAGPSWDLSATVALGLVIWGALVMGSQSLLLPVKVVSDGPIYHLYFAARWWKDGRLFLIAAPFGESAAPYFPANGDLWFTWLMLGWGGDRLARIGQVPFLALAGLAAFGLARRLGVGLSAAVVTTCWFLTCPPLFLFSFEPNVDTIFVAGYLIAAYFFLRYALDQPDGFTLALGGLAAGGALGTKATGVLFMPPLVLLAFAAIATRRFSIRRKLEHGLVLLGSTAVMSAFWYGRNAWLTGNPLYPLHVEAFGRVWLAGWYGTNVMRLSPYFIPRSEVRAGGDILLAVLDPRLAPVWLLALAGAWAIERRPGPWDRWVWGCSALALFNIALYWLLLPYRTQQRFMLQALGLAVVPLGRLLDRGRWLRLLGAVLLALHILTPQTWPFAAVESQIPWDLSPHIRNANPAMLPIPANAEQWNRLAGDPNALLSFGATLLLGLGSMLAAWAWGRWVCKSSLRRIVVAISLTVPLALGAGALAYPWSYSRPPFYPFFPEYFAGWQEFERLSAPTGSRVAYSGTDLPYYLLGSDLRNEVRYVNIDAHRDWLLHDYHRDAQLHGQGTWNYPRPGWDRIHPDYNAWLANLRAEGIDRLVVTRANPQEGPHNVADAQGFPIERQWAEAHPETFTPLYGVAERDPQFRIYSVRKMLRKTEE